MTTWLIGESPTQHTLEPFVGRSGSKLSEMAGFNVREAFRCANVLDFWPGKASSKGTPFPLIPARRGAYQIMMNPEMSPKDSIILVGGRVAKKAFRIMNEIPSYRWTTLASGTRLNVPAGRGTVRVAWIPHPSGINKHWNDARNVERLREFMIDAVRTP